MAECEKKPRKAGAASGSPDPSKRTTSNLLVADAGSQKPKASGNPGPTDCNCLKDWFGNTAGNISGKDTNAQVRNDPSTSTNTMELSAAQGTRHLRVVRKPTTRTGGDSGRPSGNRASRKQRPGRTPEEENQTTSGH